MKLGLSDSQFKILEDNLITPLKRCGAKVYAFGSRARGKHHAFSDIDILYVEDPNQPISSSKISLIKEALEESDLTIKVDLVSAKNLAVSFRDSVDKEKILL